MGLIVQKFGGTSVADVERIRNVARRVVRTCEGGHQVAVVLSAMAGETNALVALAKEVGGEAPNPREYDALTSLGESKTIALLAMSVSFLLVFVRLLRAPSLPDRVVALDMIAYVSIGFIAVYTLVTGEAAFLDAATTLALIAFLATLAFARFVERAGGGHGRGT